MNIEHVPTITCFGAFLQVVYQSEKRIQTSRHIVSLFWRRRDSLFWKMVEIVAKLIAYSIFSFVDNVSCYNGMTGDWVQYCG